mmetsp:Transcript_28438/g.62577  ORF Transcript_28438/g.62577 Transcript_28438/m.62577 type:complete len:308 (+) Transcript_28438:149-1072(+)|eukprot:CAMPEP_0202893134 /NCGR_PEP_ID=MMETSP1392-20130828/2767_1 /ASSEMBLY_ACC=CAM_ASM_000868 /TAXON_ID=225041 /ORGANISM="Chlamydomonas chlamydogama, Strain SAG 11-48b" /LENGTH=307 /DNA_ID=CAMNT_0049577347 /DNA_START=145 /DNA_END=1068 /DNA_ORIENTATION=-
MGGKAKVAEDPYKKLADQLREKKGVQYATAKLEQENGEGDYVEFFRGKDFARYLRAAPDKMEGLVQAVRPGRTVEDQIRDLIHFFINKGYVLKTDRKYKRPKPGRKRLVKWPRTLVTCQDQSWDENCFFAWKYDRPTSIWYYAGAVALPIIVILACLFPLAPWWMRMAFVYTLMALLMVLLGLIGTRYLLFGAVWIISGYSFWLFPNMMSDEVSVLDAFKPIISFEAPGRGKSAWKQRLATGAILGVVMYMLYTHSPDVDLLKEEARKAHESLVDYLDLAGRHKSFLAGDTVNGTQQQQQQQAGGKS